MKQHVSCTRISLSIGGARLPLHVIFSTKEGLGKNGFVSNSYDNPLLSLEFKAHSFNLMIAPYARARWFYRSNDCS
jgi:hypothetical protein